MSDVAEVKEAIKGLESALPSDADTYAFHTALNKVLDVARRWVRMVETGEQVWRCLKHQSDGVPRLAHDPTTCWKAEFTKHLDPADCEIVSRLVAAVGVEKETSHE